MILSLPNIPHAVLEIILSKNTNVFVRSSGQFDHLHQHRLSQFRQRRAPMVLKRGINIKKVFEIYDSVINT